MCEVLCSALYISYLIYSLLHLCVSVLTYFLGKETEPGGESLYNSVVEAGYEHAVLSYSRTRIPITLCFLSNSSTRSHLLSLCKWNSNLPCMRFLPAEPASKSSMTRNHSKLPTVTVFLTIWGEISLTLTRSTESTHTVWPIIPILGVFPREMHANVHQVSCLRMLTPLFVILSCRQLKSPSTVWQINHSNSYDSFHIMAHMQK